MVYHPVDEWNNISPWFARRWKTMVVLKPRHWHSKYVSANHPRRVHVLTRSFPKHELLSLEGRTAGTPLDGGASTLGGSVFTSDIARLMEMFQVCPLILQTELYIYCSQGSLLKYRDFEPFDDEDLHSDLTHAEDHAPQRSQNHTRSKSFWRKVRSQRRPKSTNKGKERLSPHTSTYVRLQINSVERVCCNTTNTLTRKGKVINRN